MQLLLQLTLSQGPRIKDEGDRGGWGTFSPGLEGESDQKIACGSLDQEVRDSERRLWDSARQLN
jgi:hypothetical protein